MKRDMDLLRSILILTEEQPAGQMAQDFSSLKAEQQEIIEHIWLADRAGLLEAVFAGNSPGNGRAVIKRLTPAGHDFLAHARQSVLWSKAKETAAKAGVGLTVDVMKTLLTSLANAALGRLG